MFLPSSRNTVFMRREGAASATPPFGRDARHGYAGVYYTRSYSTMSNVAEGIHEMKKLVHARLRQSAQWPFSLPMGCWWALQAHSAGSSW